MTRRNLLKSLAVAVMLPVAQVFGHEPDVVDFGDGSDILQLDCTGWEMTVTHNGKSTVYTKLNGETMAGEYQSADGDVMRFTSFKGVPVPYYERLS